VAADAPTQTLPRLGSECPNCGAHADPGQLVCLECGARLALDYRRPRGWRPAAAVIAVVVLVAAAAFAVTLVAVDDDAKDEVAATKAGKATPAAPPSKTKPKSKSRTRQRTSTPTKGGIPGWPARRNGFTVVLLSAGDEASARDFARNARKADVDAGVLRSDDYSSLEKGFWIVFLGVYKTRAQAERAAARLGGRYSGSYPQFVNGAKSR
jgi:hypothetical protein